MAGTTIEIEHLINPDTLAVEIANRWVEWNTLRQKKLEEWKELRNYLYATDTKTTGNALLPWSNTTTTPKLTQIMDNLHANYFATLFPQQKWMRFEASDRASNVKAKRDVIQAYMDNKIRQSDFVNTASDLLYDWIQYGNCFATVVHEDNYNIKEDGSLSINYIGPKLIRISPYDIVFNPTAADFQKSPKIIKSIMTLGEIKRMIDNDPSKAHWQQIIDKMMYARAALRSGDANYNKADGFIADGFTSIQQYYESDYVEVLTFYGDIYDYESNKLHSDRIITIVDRAYILDNEENPSWLGYAPIFHAGWRPRPDNLYAMGPLDNLVGMQYRIDHLENLKADVFDQIALPVLKVRGDVEEFNYSPGSRIYMGEEGDVGYLAPDATALNADFQIAELERRMEEMAGAPRESLGIRTPGEKTKFEIQTLSAASGRIFQHKAEQLESELFQPVLMAFLEAGRRNLTNSEVLKVFNSDAGVEMFKTITPEDIAANGKIVPKGASHFVESANRVQNLSQLINIKQSDPTIGVHISGKMIAELLAREMGEDKLYQPNVTISEQMETQNAMDDKEADYQDRLATLAEQGM